MAGLVQVFPSFRATLELDLARTGAAAQFRGAIEGQPPMSQGLSGMEQGWLAALLAVVGGLVFALPVAWTYIVTKRQEGYDKSVVQMILMLPVVVAAVVLVVFGELSLAFALAGIVAAVRFRTTLKDVKDAVFAFTAIGIGLAAGIQSWILAGILSGFFSLLALTLWKLEVGHVYPDFAHSAGPVSLAEVLAPGDAEDAVQVGEENLLAPLSAGERKDVAQHAERLAHYVKADALRGKKKYKQLLLVYAADPDAAEQDVERLLEDVAKRWRLVEVFAGRDGVAVMEYLVRLKKSAEIGEFLDRLEGSRGVRAAELKSVKGLRSLLT